MGNFKFKFAKWFTTLVKPPVHPFNLANEKNIPYSRWQYEKGIDTIKLYLDFTDIDTMFKDKDVLDIGCGAAGKSLYYASCGAKKVTGIEIVERYKTEALDLARDLNLEDKFEFVGGDASAMPFEDNTFDTVIMNDAMEHVDDPVGVLEEVRRVLKVGGRLYVNFPPYYHPYGAHLSDVMGTPWVQLFFSEQTLAAVYRDLVKDLPDGQTRIDFRIGQDENGKDYFKYINHMTLKRFEKIKKDQSMKIIYEKDVPLRKYFSLFAKIPGMKEAFIKMKVCVFEKTH